MKPYAEANVIASLDNTILKMAAKRAYVDGALRSTGADRIFSQDMEDFKDYIDSEAIDRNAKDAEFKKYAAKRAEEDAQKKASAVTGSGSGTTGSTTGSSGSGKGATDPNRASAKQRSLILEGINGCLEKYGKIFAEFYSKKVAVFGEKVKEVDGAFQLDFNLNKQEASTILEKVLWLKHDAEKDFQDTLKTGRVS